MFMLYGCELCTVCTCTCIVQKKRSNEFSSYFLNFSIRVAFYGLLNIIYNVIYSVEVEVLGGVCRGILTLHHYNGNRLFSNRKERNSVLPPF